MDMLDPIVQIISSVGFPIAVCLVCFFYINKREESHKSEVDKLTEAVNNNTLALTRLMDKIGEG